MKKFQECINKLNAFDVQLIPFYATNYTVSMHILAEHALFVWWLLLLLLLVFPLFLHSFLFLNHCLLPVKMVGSICQKCLEV